MAQMKAKVLAQSQPIEQKTVARTLPLAKAEVPSAFRPAWALGPVKAKAKQANKPYPAHDHRAQVQANLKKHAQDTRFIEERKKMESAENLAAVADDVEAEATLFEWRAADSAPASQSIRWYMILAVGVTVAVGLLAFLGNFMGAVAVAFIGVLLYVVSQRKPGEVRYRLMVDGIAINDRLYQYKNLAAFNIVYVPGQVKTVMVRSKKLLSPLLQLEVGDANPMEIRDILLEFLREDTNMEEPLTDAWMRRLGF